jgi:hypothetical protein
MFDRQRGEGDLALAVLAAGQKTKLQLLADE